MARRKTLYHCTVDNHGIRLKVTRKVPRYASRNEPAVPRLCVCPTIPQCIASTLLYGVPVHVYATDKPLKGVTPYRVWDEVITDERWLIPGQSLSYHLRLPRDVIDSITLDIARWHCRTKQHSNMEVRLAMLWRACVTLPQHTPRWLTRFVDRSCDELRIDPLAMFELSKALLA